MRLTIFDIFTWSENGPKGYSFFFYNHADNIIIHKKIVYIYQILKFNYLEITLINDCFIINRNQI